MLRYMTDRARTGLVDFYDIQPGNGAGLFLQPQNPHGASNYKYPNNGQSMIYRTGFTETTVLPM